MKLVLPLILNRLLFDGGRGDLGSPAQVLLTEFPLRS
jgi:hypothetical protein